MDVDTPSLYCHPRNWAADCSRRLFQTESFSVLPNLLEMPVTLNLFSTILSDTAQQASRIQWHTSARDVLLSRPVFLVNGCSYPLGACVANSALERSVHRNIQWLKHAAVIHTDTTVKSASEGAHSHTDVLNSYTGKEGAVCRNLPLAASPKCSTASP